MKLKEWEGSHGKKFGELESIISILRKTISRQIDKPKGTRLARISQTLKLKKKVEETQIPMKKVVRVKVRVPKEMMVRVRVRVEGKYTYRYNVLRRAREVLSKSREDATRKLLSEPCTR